MANTIRYPSDITKFASYFLIQRYEFGGDQFSTESLFDVSNFKYTEGMKLADMVALPIPNNLADNTSVNWVDNFERLLLGYVADKAFDSSISTVQTMARNKARTEGLALGKANVLNFEGVNTKTFSFSWEFIPQTSLEAKNVELIIDMFELGMLSSSSESSNNVYQNYPDLFKIDVAGKLNRFNALPCIVADCSVELNSDGVFQVMLDGNLPKYVLTVTFREITGRTKDIYLASKSGGVG